MPTRCPECKGLLQKCLYDDSLECIECGWSPEDDEEEEVEDDDEE